MGRRAIVVGGGIGGLATAIALDQAGWEVDVFERRESFREIGAGLTLWPNALTALDALGVGAEVRAQSLTGFDGGFMNPNGRWLTRINTEEVKDRYGEVVVMARPDLLALLLSAAPQQALHPSTEVTAVAADGTVTTSAGEHKADLVVAADGIRSIVREQLWTGAAPPRYSGLTAWRFNTGELAEPVPDGAWVWAGRLSFGYTPLPGGRAYAYAIGKAVLGGESTDLSPFAGWRDPIPRLIENIGPEGVLRHDIYETRPLKSFVNGRVALVGDSAHAMQPSLGQGACQALEDAVTLGRCADDLARYDRLRRRRTQRIVRVSRLVMASAHLTWPVVRQMRDVSYMAIPQALNIQFLKYDWAWAPPNGAGSSAKR